MTENEIQMVGHLTALRLEPGDVLVISLPSDCELTQEYLDVSMLALEKAFPGHSTVALPPGATLGAVRKALLKGSP